MKKVLIVDDDSQVRNALSLYLEDEFSLDLANSAEAALPVILGNSYDLVITDFCMLKMNGVDLIVAVRQQKPEQKFMLCTGSSGVDGLLRANEITDVPICLKGVIGLKELTEKAKELANAEG